MFQKRTPFFTNSSKNIDSKVDDVIRNEARNVHEQNSNRQRISIDQMLYEIQLALDFIGYAEIPDRQESNGESEQTNGSNSSDSDVICIL